MGGSKQVLVIGGTGFIGAPVVRALVAGGHDVTVLARGGRSPQAARVVTADRDDAAAMAAGLGGERFDLIVDLLVFDRGHVEGVFAIPRLEFDRYAFISSGQVYLVGDERHPPYRESESARPLMAEPTAGTRDHREWAYGVGKRNAEAAARELGSRRGVATTALRLPVVQGANDGSRRLWAYLQRLLDGGPLLVPDGGHNPVRFVWSEDVGRALVALLDRPPGAVASDAYNLAQPDEPTLRELLERVAAVAGITPAFVPCDEAALTLAGLDHQVSPYSGRWCSRPDPGLAARDLGWVGTPSSTWLPEVVAAHLTPTSRSGPAHPGYAHRATELALARTLVAR